MAEYDEALPAPPAPPVLRREPRYDTLDYQGKIDGYHYAKHGETLLRFKPQHCRDPTSVYAQYRRCWDVVDSDGAATNATTHTGGGSCPVDALVGALQGTDPIVVMFYAEWCPACQAYKKDVYPRAKQLLGEQKVPFIQLDADTHQIKLGKKLRHIESKIEFYPTVMLLIPTGKGGYHYYVEKIRSTTAAGLLEAVEAAIKDSASRG